MRGLQVLLVATALIVVGWFVGGKGEAGVVSAEAAEITTNSVTVGANGSVFVEPDVAYLNLAVETRGTKAVDAQQANSTKFTEVEKVLFEKFGIEKKDVQTTSFGVQPEYNYTEKDGQVLKGYVAVHSVQVTYRKLDEVGKLFDALAGAGANRIDGVRFGTENSDRYELEALKKAMSNASAKAGVLATSANRQLGGVLNIVQGNAASIPVTYPQLSYAASAKTADVAFTSVQSGQIEITATVTVQYQLK